MSKEAMKLALEALEICSVRQEHQWQGLQKMQMAEHALREALASEALDKMAENARELGLMPYDGGDYEPAQRLPDALVYDGYETPQYIEGWNDCREFMKGMK